jgi:hypothetical protein
VPLELESEGGRTYIINQIFIKFSLENDDNDEAIAAKMVCERKDGNGKRKMEGRRERKIFISFNQGGT